MTKRKGDRKINLIWRVGGIIIREGGGEREKGEAGCRMILMYCTDLATETRKTDLTTET